MACMCGAADCGNCRDLSGEPVRVCACCGEELDLDDARRGNLILDGAGVAWCWECFYDECEKPEVGGRCEGKGEGVNR